jgi:hypothetical protein
MGEKYRECGDSDPSPRPQGGCYIASLIVRGRPSPASGRGYCKRRQQPLQTTYFDSNSLDILIYDV